MLGTPDSCPWISQAIKRKVPESLSQSMINNVLKVKLQCARSVVQEAWPGFEWRGHPENNPNMGRGVDQGKKPQAD